MENSWKRNSGSMWQQSAPPPVSHDQNLFSNADQDLCLQLPQKSMLVSNGMIQEDMVLHMPGSNNMVNADLGTSYLSLLSGPMAQLPHDLQHLSNFKPMPISSQVSVNHRAASGFSAGSRVPYQQNMGWQNGKYEEFFFQLSSPNSTNSVNHGRQFTQLQDANLKFQKVQTVGCQNSHGNEKPKNFSSLFGSNNAGAISYSSGKVQDHSEITAPRKDPNGSKFSAHNHGCNPASNFPRVFCSGISGNVLLTDSGLLGVVCSCHGLYMSISKFLEHSGSYDNNPGNAVYMDNGDTVAHWREAFFSKYGIRVLEGHGIWDWPEGISAASDLVRHPISCTPNHTIPLNQVGPARNLVSCGQKPCIVMKSTENHSCSNIFDGFQYHGKERTFQESSNSLFKDLISISHGNQHHAADQQIIGVSNSVGMKNMGKASQSTRTKVNSTWSSNVLFSLPDTHNLQAPCNVFSDSRNTDSLVEGLGISSNIELKLGQPTQPSHTQKTKVSPSFGSILNDVSVESQNVFMDHLLHKTSNSGALQATLRFADVASGSGERRGTTQSDHPNHVGGAFGAIKDHPTGSFSHVVEMTDQNPLLLPCFRNPESKWHLRTTNYIGNDNHVREKMHCESDANRSDQVCFPWSKATCNIKEFGSKIPNTLKHVAKDKEVENTVNGLLGATKSEHKFSKILKEDLRTSSVDLGKSSYSYSEAFRKRSPMSALMANKSHERDILNNSWKSPSLNTDHIKSDETITMRFSSKNSAFVPCTTSLLPKEKGSRMNSGLQDVSLKMPAAQSTLILSNRDNAPASHDARVPCQLSCNLHPTERLLLSEKEQCSQILQYAYAPEKWSSAVPSKNLIGKCTLSDNSCNSVVYEDRIANGVFKSSFHSDKSCMLAKAIAKPFETTENLVSQNMKRDESHYFQWRDVPRKIVESCSSTRRDQLAGSLTINGNFRSPDSDAFKCFARSAQTVVSLKENELSSASSALSGPEITRASIEIKKIDKNLRCASNSNFVVDEVSRNDRSWSSVDALEREHCTELFDSVSQTNLIEKGSLQEVCREACSSLIDELRLQDLLKSKHQIFRNSTLQEESDHLQTAELRSKKRKKVKWMKLEPSFTVSGVSSVNNDSPKCSEEVGQNTHSVWNMQRPVEWGEGSPRDCAGSVEQSFKQRSSTFPASKESSLRGDLHMVHHQQLQSAEAQKIARFDGDIVAAPEIFRTKGLKVNSACSSSKQIQHMCCNDVALAENFTSVDCFCGEPVNFYKWMARPIVSGRYGIISNGNPSKPVKFLPLRQILKNAAHHAERSNRNFTHTRANDKLKFLSSKIKKTSVGHVNDISGDEKVLTGDVKASAMQDVESFELKHHEPSGKTETPSCSASKECTDLSDKRSDNCNKNHGITANKLRVHLKTKFKEPRRRSIHELLIKGKGSTTRYQGELMDDSANDEVQTNEINNAKRCSERPQHEKSCVQYCVCGGPNIDKYYQLLECNRCVAKGRLQNEDKATDPENVGFGKRGMVHAASFQFFPNSNTESLQAGENSLTCARTEGYQGRKREGFLHHRAQETNGNAGCLVPQEQLNAWLHIHRQKPQRKGRPKLPSSCVDSDCRKAYARYKQLKGWKHLVVYKSGIHALGLYTSQFISRGAMVVEYVGEVVGLRVADKREREYHSGKKLQHKSACYFFRIDKEHIIDATRKGGIARFVNHSCLPNCAAKVISVRNEKKVVFLAERDIYPGEEITYDYHFNHEDEGEKIPCYCNSKNCRRYLN